MNDKQKRTRRNIIKRLRRHIKKARSNEDHVNCEELLQILHRIKLNSTRPYCKYCGKVKKSVDCCKWEGHYI